MKTIETFRLAFIALGMLSTTMATGCIGGGENSDMEQDESDEVTDTVESDMSYFDGISSFSILKEYKAASVQQGKANITYPFCVYSNYDQPISSVKRESYRQTIQKAVNRWNSALVGQPGWPVQSITLQLVGTSTSCPDLSSGRKVYKVMGDKTRTRGGAYVSTYLNVAGQPEFDKETYSRELHEYGHQIGLADDYSEPGYVQPVDQPPGIMKDCFTITDLTDDDVSSVRHIWALLNNPESAPKCPAGYIVGTATEGGAGFTYCVYPRYWLTTMWLGSGKRMESTATGMVMKASSSSPAQEWRLVTPAASNGYVHIKNRQDVKDMCLDIVNDALKDKVKMTTCGTYEGQYWETEVISGNAQYVRIKNKWTGNNKCLDTDGVNLRMANCGAVSGQYWKTQQH
jgi:hypothetical protein